MLLILVSLQTSIPLVCCRPNVFPFWWTIEFLEQLMYTLRGVVHLVGVCFLDFFRRMMSFLSSIWLVHIRSPLKNAFSFPLKLLHLGRKKVREGNLCMVLESIRKWSYKSNIPSRFERHGCGMMFSFEFKASLVLTAFWSSRLIENLDIASFKLSSVDVINYRENPHIRTCYLGCKHGLFARRM